MSPASGAPIRVVVVEDSPTQRLFLAKVLEAEGDIAVVGHAVDAGQAVDEVRRHRPDVVTMDLRLPGGGGQAAIETIMATLPTPILVLSAAVEGRESTAAFDALMAGAVEVSAKPATWTAEDERQLRARVRLVRGVKVVRHMRQPASRLPVPGRAVERPVVALAASTGGPAALVEVIGRLRGLAAPMLVVQHLHAEFVPGFVEWMGREVAMPVAVARAGAELQAGEVVVAPGDRHLVVGPDRRVVLSADPPGVHRPSANELFASLARHVGAATVGVLLTGMGEDGAVGLRAVRQAGGVTIAQDEATSAVFGMPRAALDHGAVDRVVPLAAVPGMVWAAVTGGRA